MVGFPLVSDHCSEAVAPARPSRSAGCVGAVRRDMSVAAAAPLAFAQLVAVVVAATPPDWCTGVAAPIPGRTTALARHPVVTGAAEDGRVRITWGVQAKLAPAKSATGIVEWGVSGDASSYNRTATAENLPLMWENYDDTPLIKRMTRFSAWLEDVPAAQAVCYRVKLDGKELIGGLSFGSNPRATTPAASAASYPVKFIAFGDFGIGEENQWNRSADQPWFNPTNAEAQVRNVMRSSGKFNDSDFMLALGDDGYFSGDPHEYDQRTFPYYYREWSVMPLFITAGNHDYGHNKGQSYLDAFPQREQQTPAVDARDAGRYYSARWGGLHISAIDTEWGQFDTSTDANSRMATWFNKDLAAAAASPEVHWIIVIMHKTPFNLGNIPGDGDGGPQIHSTLLPIMMKHKVDLLMGGHWHNLQRYPPIGPNGSLISVVSGGGGYAVGGETWDACLLDGHDEPLANGGVTPALVSHSHHFLHWEFQSHCNASMVAIDTTGKEIDRLNLNKC